MELQELQALASIISDATIVTIVLSMLVWTEKRRIFLANSIFEDWKKMREHFMDKLRDVEK